MADLISGVVERITFHNADTGYSVLRVQVRGEVEPIAVVGVLSQAIAGEQIEARGSWVNDKNYGRQFKADEIRSMPPHTLEGIEKYLSSGFVKGIGSHYAKKIVSHFGEKTLEVIDQSVAQLSQIPGIGPKRIEKIRESWKQSQTVRNIVTFLMSYGIGPTRATKIFKIYGENAISIVRANPYRLSEDIWGIGFQTADELALSLGIPRDAPQRAQAGVRHVLREAASRQGHVGLPEPLLIEETAKLTQITSQQVSDAILQLQLTEEIVRDFYREDAEPLIYRKALFQAEIGVSEMIRLLNEGSHPLPDINTDSALEWVEKKLGFSFAASQIKAVRRALQDKLLVVTGGPGTGKTTIVRAIIDIFSAKNLNVKLSAPTGRAAKRLSESTQREAKTIHRMLEYDAGINGFRRNRDNPLDLDLLVVDECSMVDISLMFHLLRAVPPKACVVLVGDVDQLPSVGPGSVLRDLITSGSVSVSRLTEIHRQAGASYIVRAAHAVNQGEEPESAPQGQGDFYFMEVEEPAMAIDRMLLIVKERIPAKFGLNPIQDIQVLSPMNKTELGVQNLNIRIQECLNPLLPGMSQTQRFGTSFRVGDKVLQTRNNYTREVFNGDIGRITLVDETEQIVGVDFEGRPVEYEFSDLDEIQLAYAISIHKSQGSEYPAVVIPVHTQHWVMLQRNLLYTGITRGRKLVVLIGKRQALRRAIQNAEMSRRFGRLMERIQF